MITWLTLKQQVATGFLDDPTYQTYTETKLLWAINDALTALASSYTGVASVSDITGDGTTVEWSLPDNIINERDRGVFGVRWTDDETWLRELDYQPGATVDPSNTYTVWPTGTLGLYQAPADGDTFRVYYIAYYDGVTADDSIIAVPPWAREALKCYCASSVLAPAYAQQALIRNYQSKRDAGNPEDNPQLRLAQHFMKRYHIICQQHPQEQWKRMGTQR